MLGVSLQIGAANIGLRFLYTTQNSEPLRKHQKALTESKKFKDPIVVPITKFTAFYPAEDYHQDFYITNPARYYGYKRGSGREGSLKETWGDALDKPLPPYTKPSDEELQT